MPMEYLDVPSLPCRRRLMLGAAAAVALGVGRPRHGRAAAGVGVVARLQGNATVSNSDGRTALAPGAAIGAEDLILTGEDARLLLEFNDGTKVTLGGDTAFRVNDYVFDTAGDQGSFSGSLFGGAFLFVTGEISRLGRQDLAITTPVGNIGIQGTTVWGGALDGGFGVLLSEGRIVFSNAGGQVTLDPGEGLQLTGAGQLPGKRVWPQAKVNRAVAEIAFR